MPTPRLTADPAELVPATGAGHVIAGAILGDRCTTLCTFGNKQVSGDRRRHLLLSTLSLIVPGLATPEACILVANSTAGATLAPTLGSSDDVLAIWRRTPLQIVIFSYEDILIDRLKLLEHLF